MSSLRRFDECRRRSYRLCSTCPHRSVRGRFLIGWVRSLRERSRAAAPTMAATSKEKDRKGDYQETLDDVSLTTHPGLGCCAGVPGTGR